MLSNEMEPTALCANIAHTTGTYELYELFCRLLYKQFLRTDTTSYKKASGMMKCFIATCGGLVQARAVLLFLFENWEDLCDNFIPNSHPELWLLGKSAYAEFLISKYNAHRNRAPATDDAS